MMQNSEMKKYLNAEIVLEEVDIKVSPTTGRVCLTLKGSGGYKFNSISPRDFTSLVLESKRLLDSKIGETIYLLEGDDDKGFCVAFIDAGTFSFWDMDIADQRPDWYPSL